MADISRASPAVEPPDTPPPTRTSGRPEAPDDPPPTPGVPQELLFDLLEGIDNIEGIAEAEIDRLAAGIFAARQAHHALRQAHLEELSLGALKNKLRILGVAKVKIDQIDYADEPKHLASKLLLRADKPAPESWRVKGALAREHEVAQRLAHARLSKQRHVTAGNLVQAQSLKELDQALKKELTRKIAERLSVALADEQQMLRGEQLRVEVRQLKQKQAELTTAQLYGEAHEVSLQAKAATKTQRAVAHSLRSHHLDELATHSQADDVLGRSNAGKTPRYLGSQARADMKPFGSKTHKCASKGWHSRSWHMNGKTPSLDAGARMAEELREARRASPVHLEEGSATQRKVGYRKDHGTSVWLGEYTSKPAQLSNFPTFLF